MSLFFLVLRVFPDIFQRVLQKFTNHFAIDTASFKNNSCNSRCSTTTTTLGTGMITAFGIKHRGVWMPPGDRLASAQAPSVDPGGGETKWRVGAA